MIVLERQWVVEYVIERQILHQYKKAKQHLQDNRLTMVQFKKRKPLSNDLYQFRITQKYRAIGYFIEDVFVVIEVNDHQ